MISVREKAIDILWEAVGGSYSDLLELVHDAPPYDSPRHRAARKMLASIEKGLSEDRAEIEEHYSDEYRRRW